MASIGVRNDWSEVVDVGNLVSLGFWGANTFFSLLSVMEELCHEKVLYFVRYGILKPLSVLNLSGQEVQHTIG